MSKTLSCTFQITCDPEVLLDLASRPLLAPAYLNFLETIEPGQGLTADSDWAPYTVRVAYRSILKTSGLVEHRVDKAARAAHLRHDGPLAQFEAIYRIIDHQVELNCAYTTKVPLVSWLVRTVLNRALVQIAAAMDRYAASRTAAPT